VKSTVDTYTGKRFRYNELVEYQGYTVPGRTTAHASTHLAADRMPAKLFAVLNPGRQQPAARKDLLSND
jgi:hypothetical protein